MKLGIVEFLETKLGLHKHVLSDKGWFRTCCVAHEETRPSFGVLTVWPYISKCFSCGFRASLPELTAKVLKTSRERALQIVHEQVDVKIELREQGERKVQAVPSAVIELFEDSYTGSIGEKYARYRGIPKWAGRLWNFGYNELDTALVIPLRNTQSGQIQAYSSVQIQGTFQEVYKSKPKEAGSMVTVPSNYNAFSDCIVVEGIVDAVKAGMALWAKGIMATPIALNTCFTTKEQMKFIRRFNRVYLGFDHDQSGQQGFDLCRKQLKDKAYVYEFVYDENKKDPGELKPGDDVSVKLIF